MFGVAPEFVQDDLSSSNRGLSYEAKQEFANSYEKNAQILTKHADDLENIRPSLIEMDKSIAIFINKMSDSPQSFSECYKTIIDELKNNELSNTELVYNVINDNGISNNVDINFIKLIENNYIKYDLRRHLEFWLKIKNRNFLKNQKDPMA